MGRISPGPTRWPPGAERRLVPAKSNLKPQTTCCGRGCVGVGAEHSPWPACPVGAALRGGGGGPSPWRVACHRCEGRLVSGAVPPPVIRPLGPAAGVPRPVCPGCGRCGRGDPLRGGTSPRACSFAGRRCSQGGWQKGVPGGGAFHRREGRLRSGAPPPPTAHPLGGLFGSATHVLRARACECGGPLRFPWPACPVGAACRGGRGGPSPGGWPATVVRGVWCQALSLPWPPVLWSGRPGFRDPCVPGAVDAGVGTQRRPHSVRPCGPALLAVGVAEGRPRWGAFHHCEGRLMSGAVPPPTARPLGGLLGSATHVLWAGVCACGGPAVCPWLAIPCGGRAQRGSWGPSPGGWPATVVRGVWCQALSLSRSPAVWAGRRGPPPTCCGRGRAGVGARQCPLGLHALWELRAAGVGGGRCRGGWPATVARGIWGPSTVSTACALAGRRCSLWGWRKGVPGGGAFHRCGGRLRSGAPPPPTARPPGGLLGSATHVLWARLCGCWGPTLLSWPACPVGAALRGGGGVPSPWRVACNRSEGRLVSGAVPPPATRPLGRAAGVPGPVCPGCGRCGRGDPLRGGTGPRACALAGRRCSLWGWRKGVPGGVPSTIVRGV